MALELDPAILPRDSITLVRDRFSQTTLGVSRVGGKGDVFQGIYSRNDGTNEIVAIKIFRESSHQSLDDINRRLNRETIIWAHLDHDQILHFHGVYQFPSFKRMALVLPWLDNGSAPAYLKKNGRTGDLPYILKLTKQIISGVRYLHQNGVVHGDLKGNNILIDTHANAKIADFGCAHVIDEIEVFEDLCTSISWTAPEVMNPPNEKLSLTKMSDMWSLGITILELFDGEESLWGMKHKIQTKLVLVINAPGKKPEEKHYPQTKKIEGLWNCLYPCWNRDTEPIDRVTAEDLVANLAQIMI